MTFDTHFDRRSVFLTAWAILIVAATWCYAPCLSGPFVYDDTSLVRDNLRIRSFSNARDWFGTTLHTQEEPSGYYRPLLLASFAVDHAAWGSNTVGYHLMNLLWHLANVGLMAALARRIGWGRGAAYLSAWIFAIHPLNAQAVCYISGRGDVQFLGLCLLACHAALSAWEQPARSTLWNGAAAMLASAAILTKEMGILVLVWVPLLAWLKGMPKKTWLTSMGFLLLGAALVVAARLSASDPSPLHEPPVPIPPMLYVQLFFRAIGFYASHFAAPIVLALDRSIIPPTPLHHFYFALGIGLFLAAIFAAIQLFRSHRKRALFCLAWAVAGFLPVSNLIRLSATAADHWLYAASIGLAWGIALAVCRLLSNTRLFLDAVACLVFAALIGFWGVRLHARSSEWSSGIALYQANLAQGVASTRILNNYGLELAQGRRYADALVCFENAVRMDPRNLSARANHGFILFLTGHEEEGRAELRRLTREVPSYQQGWVALMLTCRNDPAELRKIGGEALQSGRHFPKVEALMEQSAPSPPP